MFSLGRLIEQTRHKACIAGAIASLSLTGNTPAQLLQDHWEPQVPQAASQVQAPLPMNFIPHRLENISFSNPQLSDLRTPSWQANQPITISESPAVCEHETSLHAAVKQELVDLVRDNWVTVAAGLGAMILVAWRHFPNRLNIDCNQLAELKMLRPEGSSGEGCPNLKILAPNTLFTANLSDIFGLDIYAFARFHAALLGARAHNFWPILSFSNNDTAQRFGGVIDDIIGRATRSEMNAALRGEDGAIELVNDSINMLNGNVQNKHPLPERNAVFLVYTFERLDDVYQPRLYFMPAADVINCLCDLPVWWEAAQNTSNGAQRRLVRCLEISGSLLYRYPKMLECIYDSHPKFEQAKRVATEIRRMYALPPDESLEFIEKYNKGERSPEFLEPTKEEWATLEKTWYHSNDKNTQNRIRNAEAKIEKITDYAAFCKKEKAPMWFFNLYV
jgi:hypothetical protein